MHLENSRLTLSFNVLRDNRTAAVGGVWGTLTPLCIQKNASLGLCVNKK